MSLLKGKYRVEISAIGYREAQSEFVLGLGEDEKLPKMILEKSKMTLGQWWNYYRGTSGDVAIFSMNFLDNLMTSTRFLNLVKFWVMLSTLFVFWKYLIKRLKINWWLLLVSILFSVKNLFRKREKGETFRQ